MLSRSKTVIAFHRMRITVIASILWLRLMLTSLLLTTLSGSCRMILALVLTSYMALWRGDGAS